MGYTHSKFTRDLVCDFNFGLGLDQDMFLFYCTAQNVHEAVRLAGLTFSLEGDRAVFQSRHPPWEAIPLMQTNLVGDTAEDRYQSLLGLAEFVRRK